MLTGTCHPFFSYFSSANVRSGLCLLRVLLIIELEGREASSFQRKPSEMKIDGLICSILYCLGYIYKKYIHNCLHLQVVAMFTWK